MPTCGKRRVHLTRIRSRMCLCTRRNGLRLRPNRRGQHHDGRLDDIACEHEAAVRYALELYRNHTLDFADCMLAARFVVEGTPVLTFDKKLNRLLEELA